MTTHTRLLAALTAGILTLGLTACGGDDQDSADPPMTVSVSQDGPAIEGITDEMRDGGFTVGPDDVAYGGFDTPREQEAATTAYACQRMPDEDPALVYKRAYDTIMDNIILESSFADGDFVAADLVRQVNMAANGALEATCDENSPYYRTWVKVGYSTWVQGVEEPSRADIEESGALDTEQYQREVSGEARSILNP